MSWQNIIGVEIAAGAPISQELIVKLDQRDKAALELPVGGYWPETYADLINDGQLLLWIKIPRAASNLYIECEAGSLGPQGADPGARVYLKNPSNGVTSHGEFLDLTGIDYPARVQFPPIPIPALFRGALLELWYDANDSVGAPEVFYCRNLATSATCGYGLRFG